jgi:hypothetical protein
VYDWLKDMKLYDDNDASPGCYSPDTWVTTLLQTVRDWFDGEDLTSSSTVKLCLPKTFGDMTEVHSLSSFPVIFPISTYSFFM